MVDIICLKHMGYSREGSSPSSDKDNYSEFILNSTFIQGDII